MGKVRSAKMHEDPHLSTLAKLCIYFSKSIKASPESIAVVRNKGHLLQEGVSAFA